MLLRHRTPIHTFDFLGQQVIIKIKDITVGHKFYFIGTTLDEPRYDIFIKLLKHEPNASKIPLSFLRRKNLMIFN